MSNSRDEICEPEIAYQKGQVSTWPFYLVSYFLKEEELPRYPLSPNRYGALDWNSHFQYCYTKEDISLMQRIHAAYQALINENNPSDYFQLREEKRWYDWWICTQPAYNDLLRKFESDSFTLPNRESKDTKQYPLWSTADNMARQIANWQGERIKNQNVDLMNDPVMLVFEELRDWFFQHLSQKECNNEVLETIAKRVSYVKNLIHLIPHFGPDRFHLLEIQHVLEDCSKTVTTCVANKELPQLLSDIVIAGKSLETAVGTYLHFSIDEEVADNFSVEFLENSQRNCHLSPVCKIYKATRQSSDTHFQELSHFYQFVKMDEKDNNMRVKMVLKKNPLVSIKFASFVTARDKEIYLETLATLDAMMTVRKTIDKFHQIQSSLGTYLFAVNYIETANQLAAHYINLINKTKLLTKSLIQTSDNGLSLILRNQENKKKQNTFFEKNLRTLETRVAKGTTISAQFDSYCTHATESINKYQQAIRKLASDVDSGIAQHELEHAMQDVFLKMKYMNAVLPAVLGEVPLTLHHDAGMEVLACDASDNRICTIKMLPDVAVKPSMTPPAPTPCSSTDDYKAIHIPFDSGKWDDEIKQDVHTGKPLFTYRVFDDGIEVGTATFYGSPLLCQSEDKQRHNLIQLTGVLSEFHITDAMNVTDVCQALPPTLFDKVLVSASEGATHGFLRGGATIVGVTLQSFGLSKTIANYLSQFIYYGGLFSLRFHSYYEQIQEYDDTTRCLNAMYSAAVDTGKIWVMNVALHIMNMVGDYVANNYYALLGKGIKKCSGLLRFGIYAHNAIDSGIVETSTAMLTGRTAEMATEQVGNYMVSKLTKS